MRLNRSWLQKATDADLILMHDNVEAQIDELMIGMLDDTNNPMPATKLSSLELEIDVIKGEIALRQIEAKKPVEVAVVEPKTAVILQFKPRNTAAPDPQVQASNSSPPQERA